MELGDREQSWEIIGFAKVTHAEHFSPPSTAELRLMEARQPLKAKAMAAYEFPVAGVVSVCGAFARRMQVRLPWCRPVVALPAGSLDGIAQAPLAGRDETLEGMVGCQCRRWSVLKYPGLPVAATLSHLVPLLSAGVPFRLPLWPSESSALGFSLGPPTLPCQVPSFLPEEEEKEESDDDGSEDASDDENASKDLYTPEAMLAWLKLSRMLKPGANLREALAVASELIGADTGRVRDPSCFRVPARSTLRAATIQVDCCMMAWSRYLWAHGYQSATCLLADSSEQGRVEFFCQRSDTVVIPRGLSASCRLKLRLSDHFSRAILPLGCLGSAWRGVAWTMVCMRS